MKNNRNDPGNTDFHNDKLSDKGNEFRIRVPYEAGLQEY